MGAEVGRFECFVFLFFIFSFILSGVLFLFFWDSNFLELIDSC